MYSLRDLTIKKTREILLEKKVSCFELTKEMLQFAEKKDKKTGAYISLFHDDVLEQASRVDVKLAKGDRPGALFGAPLAIKDNICISGTPTTAASKILEEHRAVYSATVIDKLAKEDAVFLGKTNMDEFAMGSSTENSALRTTVNPHDEARVPGGSSGGSAAAVAANEAVAALGSDTGGSIRQPAAFCGVVGLKPTYGAVSRYGLIAMASSLDQIGPITKTVEDAALLFRGISGKDEKDATSADASYGKELADPDLDEIKKLTVGIPREYLAHDMDGAVAEGLEKAKKSLESLGITIKEISLSHTQYAAACYYVIMPAEVSSNLARFDGIRYSRIAGPRGDNRKNTRKKLHDIYITQRGEGFGVEAKRRIMLGTFVLSSGYYDAYYAKAQKVRALIKQDFDAAFEDVDVILAPVTPTPAFALGEKTDDPLAMYLSDIFTIPANLAGLPAISIPVRDAFSPPYQGGERGGLPVGFQLIGRHFREADILGLGIYYDKLFGIGA